MSTYVCDCPRCGSKKHTFDILQDVYLGTSVYGRPKFEAFGRCRGCRRPSILSVEAVGAEFSKTFHETGHFTRGDYELSPHFVLQGFVTAADMNAKPAPEGLPEPIYASFAEGCKCLAVGCFNAASTMFRLCLDQATRARLPPDDEEGGPTRHQRRNLAPRLAWLIEVERLGPELKHLSDAVKDFGDEGAHEGVHTAAEAEDIYEFAFRLLDRLYGEPLRLQRAMERREARRRAE